MDGTFSSFMNVLQHCPSVKVISLEGNPLPDQSYHKLISDDLGLVHISLRNNQINDEGARLISQALQSLKITNKHLATLVLSYNHITDLGAGYIAQQAEAPEVSNPLLEQAEFRDGKVFLPGNKVLINLNLSRNRVTEEGLRSFLAAMETQVRETKVTSGARTHTGLLRLSLGKNKFPAECSTFVQIQEIMVSRDPIYKSPRSSVDEQVM
ncbi:hypothetical protein GDO78_021201 [Eleutherodactylus coqui]|nr:hypothetical protein GDO78_021201 [Eleutherodactylus coqui]